MLNRELSGKVWTSRQRFCVDATCINFRLALAGKAAAAKTVVTPKNKAVTAKKAESSSDSDSGNSSNHLVFC